MDSTTGKRLTGINHLRQSIRDILTTPVGSRVMRRPYGSRIYELVDAPLNNGTLVDIYAATAEAILRWEPRFRVTRIQVENASLGKVTLRLQGEYRPTQELINLDGLEIN